jgi:predicted ArsR family transcriptional regulator
MTEAGGPLDASAWELAQLLCEPHRREVYRAVRQSRTPMTRDQVALATGINRRLTAFHLERLAAAGFLVTDYARPEGHGGPGSGRPAKRYAACGVEVEVSEPSRHYLFAARLLARAVRESPQDAEQASLGVAREEGRRIGASRRPAGRPGARRVRAAVLDALDELGYEPADEAPCVRLRNCPFRSVVDIAPELVCGMNHALVGGLLEGAGLPRAEARLEGTAPDCCVVAVMPR